MSYGRVSTYTTGTVIHALAGPPAKANVKTGGLTLDWTTVAAASGDQTMADGTVIKSGQKGLQYGTVLTLITATGLYGPYDSGASDGRQLLARGQCYILDESVLQTPIVGLGASVVNHPAGYDGGTFYLDRVQVVGGAALQPTGVSTNRPTLANFEAAFPLVRWVRATG